MSSTNRALQYLLVYYDAVSCIAQPSKLWKIPVTSRRTRRLNRSKADFLYHFVVVVQEIWLGTITYDFGVWN